MDRPKGELDLADPIRSCSLRKLRRLEVDHMDRKVVLIGLIFIIELLSVATIYIEVKNLIGYTR